MLIKSSNQYEPQNFGAMTKNQFKGIDRLFVEKFQPPIEKMNANEDLQKWAKNKLVTDIFTKNLEGRTPRVSIERMFTWESWKGFLDNATSIPATAATIALTAIFGKLSTKTDDVPPPLDEKVLVKKALHLY